MKRKIVMSLIAGVLALVMMSGVCYAVDYRGDVDGDGVVSLKDSRTALRVSTRLDKLPDVDNAFLRADINGDGKITAVDARIILRMAIEAEPLAELQ